MRIDRLIATAVALVASTIVISCGDDNNVTPSNNSGNSPAVVNSVPAQDTTPAVTTEPVGGPGY
jgi:hypothetical protein